MSWKLLKNSENITLGLIEEEKPKHIFLGVSGGVDSVVLAYFFKNIANKISYLLDVTVLHLNHSLRAESDREEDFCRTLAKNLGFRFISEKILPSKAEKWGSDIENKARGERKKFFRNHLSDKDILLLAHHLDDDIEWNFLQRFKSSSVGKTMYIPSRNGYIFRPFLEVEKTTLTKVAQDLKIYYIVDSSNSDDRFERNFVRNNLVPLVDSRFKNFREHFIFQKYQNISTLEVDLIKRNIYQLSSGSTLLVEQFSDKKEDLFKAISFWLNSCLKKCSNGTGRGSISRQILKIIEAIGNNKKGPLILSGGMFCYVDSVCLHLMHSDRYFIKGIKNLKTEGPFGLLDEDILKNGPIYLLDKPIEGSPASEFGLPRVYNGLSIVTSGYIIKNLKKLKKWNPSLFKGLIEEKSS